MLLFFDTETTGLVDHKAPPEAKHQPNLVQIAACLTDDAADRIFGQLNFIVVPIDFTIPDKMAAIHKINQKLAMAVGQPRRTVLSAFNFLCKGADTLVAHNLDFDHAVMQTAYCREGVKHRMQPLAQVCTMRAATPILKLPKANDWHSKAPGEYKWPSLMECYKHFFGETFNGAHNAMNDVVALMAIWRELHRLKAL